MGVGWTEDQQKAIEQRDTNILISAAAGSGKTAVLVERILTIIMDPEHPVDVDRLLIVTFTRAAAAEMKDRIGKALEERLQQDPENEHLQKQGILLHHAQISTIHGFCTYVIQNYFHRIGLDPGYRIAEDSEIAMMKREVLEELLEQEYEKGDAAFLSFMEAFAPGKTDKAAEELIRRLHEFAISDPCPEEWLENCQKVYEIDSEEELEASEWLLDGVREGKALLGDVKDRILDTLELAKQPGGPTLYISQLESDLERTLCLLELTSYRELVRGFANLEHEPLSRRKMTGVREDLKKQVTENRNTIKKSLKNIGEKYFSVPVDVMLEELRHCRVHAAELVRLTRCFAEGFDARKRKSNILDFSDLEHFALQILTEKQGDQWVRTEAARELSTQFHEIMIDEYQDSNFVQEALLRAVSGEEDGRFNRFMVGDIKQSIYGFRQAKPELFLEKYDTYSRGDTAVRIDLKKNFRSRQQVLDTVNTLFQRLMVPALGGIQYDEAAALHLGATYGEAPKESCNTEMILIDRKTPELEDVSQKEDLVEMEAMAVAARIKEMLKTQKVYDLKQKAFRPASYRDFAILLRAFKGRAEVFLRVLKNEGIPAFAISKTGYFSTIEVSTVLNYLRLLDNPRQDIPYAAILRSPIVGVEDEELALIRCALPEMALFEAVPTLAEAADGEYRISASLKRKLTAFLEKLEYYRDLVPCIPVHELLTQVLDGTGYRNLAASLPMGEQRVANLNLLVEKAVNFEATSYHGLFQFIRSIDQMEKNQMDFGEVNLYGETADAVGIVTIHKSKGLEYPFVFVSCLGGKFSNLDTKASVIFHSKLGIGLNYVDPEQRVRHSTMVKKMVAERIRLEMLAEELRVLYVALTRAKEKLILTALVDNLKKRLEECVQTPSLKKQPLPYGRLAGAGGYLDWILPVIAGCDGFQSVYEMYLGESHPAPELDLAVKVTVQSPEAIALGKIAETVEKHQLHEEMLAIGEDPDVVYDATVHEFLDKKMAWSYEYDYRNSLPAVMSVSELKKKRPSEQEEELYEGSELPDFAETAMYPEPGEQFLSVAESQEDLSAYPLWQLNIPAVEEAEQKTIEEEEATRQQNIEEEDVTRQQNIEEKEVTSQTAFEEEVYLPAFMREKEVTMKGALRGTAYHRFLECVDYNRMPKSKKASLYSFVEEQIWEMLQSKKLEQAEADCLYRRDLVHFLESDLGQRMRRAAGRGKLYREQPFLMNLASKDIDPAWDFDETILVRGVVDACFEERNRLVIVDYKTDRLQSEDGCCLIEKYAKQLHYYQRALEKGSSRLVKERLIYSFALGKAIAVPAEE